MTKCLVTPDDENLLRFHGKIKPIEQNGRSTSTLECSRNPIEIRYGKIGAQARLELV